jgi:hypothetical protein
VVGYRTVLPDQLVEPLTGHDPVAIGVDIRAVASAWRHPVYRHTIPNRAAAPAGSEDEMQIAGVEPTDDAAVFRVENGALFADRPNA